MSTEITTENTVSPVLPVTTNRIDLTKLKRKFVQLSIEELLEIPTDGNWRTDDDLQRLAAVRWEELREEGQEKELLVYREGPDQPLKMDQGHCRQAAFGIGFRQLGGVEFAKLFPTISVIEIECTRQTAARLKFDNAKSENMRTGDMGRADFTAAAMILFAAGLERAEVLRTLETQIDKVNPAYSADVTGPLLVTIDQTIGDIDAELVVLSGEIVEALTELEECKEVPSAVKALNKVLAGTRKNTERLKADRARLLAERDVLTIALRKGQGDMLVQHRCMGALADWVRYHTAFAKRHPDSIKAGIDTTGWKYDTKKMLPQFKRAVMQDLGVKSFKSADFSDERRARVDQGPAYKEVFVKFQAQADKRIKGIAKKAADKAAGKKPETAGKRMNSTEIQGWGKAKEADGAKILAQVFSGKIKQSDPGVTDAMDLAAHDLDVTETIRVGNPEFYQTMLVEYKRLKALAQASADTATTTVPSTVETTPDADETIVVEGPPIGTAPVETTKPKTKRKSRKAKGNTAAK